MFVVPSCLPIYAAMVLCDPDNRDLYLGFCFIIQYTGFDIILNDNELLDDEYQLPFDDLDELEELLTEFGLLNLLDLLPASGTRLLHDVASVQDHLDENYPFRLLGTEYDEVFTVFAPSNEAIAALPFEVLWVGNALEFLGEFVESHVFAGDEALEYDDLDCEATIVMSNGANSTITCKTNAFGNTKKFLLGDTNTALKAKIKFRNRDKLATNGIVQSLDSAVLLPTAVPSTLPSEAPSLSPSAVPSEVPTPTPTTPTPTQPPIPVPAASAPKASAFWCLLVGC